MIKRKVDVSVVATARLAFREEVEVAAQAAIMAGGLRYTKPNDWKYYFDWGAEGWSENGVVVACFVLGWEFTLDICFDPDVLHLHSYQASVSVDTYGVSVDTSIAVSVAIFTRAFAMAGERVEKRFNDWVELTGKDYGECYV